MCTCHEYTEVQPSYSDDSVAILPNGLDPNQQHDLSKYWVAKIKDIRAEEYPGGSNSVSGPHLSHPVLC